MFLVFEYTAGTEVAILLVLKIVSDQLLLLLNLRQSE